LAKIKPPTETAVSLVTTLDRIQYTLTRRRHSSQRRSRYAPAPVSTARRGIYFLPIDRCHKLVHPFGEDPRLSRRQIYTLCRRAFPEIFTIWKCLFFRFDILLERGRPISRLPACVQQHINEHTRWDTFPFLAVTCHDDRTVSYGMHEMP